jgi:hypothetical protein
VPLKIDYAPAPTSWREAIERADLVAVVRLRAKQHVDVGPNDFPRTVFHADVLELIGGPHASSIGQEIVITRFGGTTRVRGVLRNVEEGRFRTWENGESFLLFLKWHGPYGAYSLPFGPDAAFEDDNSGKVRTSGVGILAMRHSGRGFSILLNEVRAAAGRF